ncbi:hypothetical protein [Posidoniimonas corsicana]|uniref:hypothetical protein n=1 Tax=Posidoniimonas corsicana TaxID=1938618 RepID=UPI0011B3E30C|nr:hypothetical protein [Posidoniimonas corsicana]
MQLLLRHLVLLLTAAGTVIPSQALAQCGCADARRQAAAEADQPSCCQATAGCCGASEVSCCQDKTGDTAEHQQCCGAGGCRCLGCDGSRPEAPQINYTASVDDLKMVDTLAFAPLPVVAPTSELSAATLVLPPRLGAPPGVRLQAVLCVWTI